MNVVISQLHDGICLFHCTYCGDIFVSNLSEIVISRIHGKEDHIINLTCLVMKQITYRDKCLNVILPFQYQENWSNPQSRFKTKHTGCGIQFWENLTIVSFRVSTTSGNQGKLEGIFPVREKSGNLAIF